MADSSQSTSAIRLASAGNPPVEHDIKQSDVDLSVVIPCFNERHAVEQMMQELERALAPIKSFEIIVVDDGSTDGTAKVLDTLEVGSSSMRVIRHNINKGYGGALKTGIRHAQGRFVAITDADGTYPNDRIPDLLARAEEGADMVVGARVKDDVGHSKIRAFPKAFMRRYCVWLTRQPIPDMNSGLRVFKRNVIERFLAYLPDTFSFTTTVTIAFMTNSYCVEYVPIVYGQRVGQSKISPFKDTIRFVQLILRFGLYFAPLRVFGPFILFLWAVFFGVAGHSVFVEQDLTQTDLLLLNFATTATMLALVADMIDKRLR